MAIVRGRAFRRRSKTAKELSDRKYHQRVVPDKKKSKYKQQEEFFYNDRAEDDLDPD
jgi:hypothetical protein